MNQERSWKNSISASRMNLAWNDKASFISRYIMEEKTKLTPAVQFGIDLHKIVLEGYNFGVKVRGQDEDENTVYLTKDMYAKADLITTRLKKIGLLDKIRSECQIEKKIDLETTIEGKKFNALGYIDRYTNDSITDLKTSAFSPDKFKASLADGNTSSQIIIYFAIVWLSENGESDIISCLQRILSGEIGVEKLSVLYLRTQSPFQAKFFDFTNFEIIKIAASTAIARLRSFKRFLDELESDLKTKSPEELICCADGDMVEQITVDCFNSFEHAIQQERVYNFDKKGDN